MSQVTTLSEAKRKLLEKYLRDGAQQPAHPTATKTRKPGDQPAPLSLSQEQLVLRERRLQGNPAPYNECITLKMRGPVNVSVLEQSLNEIVRRHEIWRTTYDLSNSQLVQMVHSPDDARITIIEHDLRGMARHEQLAEIKREVGGMVRRPFDLTRGPLLRARLVHVADTEHRLYICAHLSIVDGVSVYQVFPSELCALYLAYLQGQPSPLADLDLQFVDYAYWQRQAWQEQGPGVEQANQIAFWAKRLAGPIPVLNWPTGRARPARETFRGAIRAFTFPGDLIQKVKALSRNDGVTLFMALLAAFVVLLHRYTGQDDIIVGTPSPAGRKRPEVQKLLGYFLNPVALRFDLTAEPTFRQLLRQAQRLTLEALANDDVPLEILCGELRVNPDSSRNPFFTVAISQQPPMPKIDLPWSVTSMDIESGGAPWDLYIAFIDQPAETMARVQYNPDIFPSETIEHVLCDYRELLAAVTDHPDSTTCWAGRTRE
jgi:hypothetical protein